MAAPESMNLEEAIQNAPAWLISALFHMVLMIALALLLLPSLLNEQVALEATFADTLGAIDSQHPFSLTDSHWEPASTQRELPMVPELLREPPKIDLSQLGTHASGDPIARSPGGYRGRETGAKGILGNISGANRLTREAVVAGLKWLARNQQRDGSWSLIGPYADGAEHENREAATAMALLAFQGDGNTTDNGKYQREVKRAWYYLLRQQDSNGCFFREGSSIQRFYTQGQATIAVCELFGMTKDPLLKASYREPAEKAIDYCVRGQSSAGGWRYAPQEGSDVSVTGWILMALQSARMAGLEVPEGTLDKAARFLDSVCEGGSRYAYQRGDSPNRVMTAEALLCRQYLGWKRDNVSLHEGVEWLLQPENELSYTNDRDVYYLVLRHSGHAPHGGRPLEKVESHNVPGSPQGPSPKRPRSRQLAPA